MVLHDITAEAGPAEHSPELRAALEELGWRVLGRVRLGTDEQIRDFMRTYDASVAPVILERELVGATVMADADGTAFAFVDWFFHCPYTRLMTMLDDGRLVATEEAWTADPVQQDDMRPVGVLLRRRQEQTRAAAAGHSIVLVDHPTAADLVAAHREHVARVVGGSGARPAPHRSLPVAMDVWRQQFAHARAVGGRTGLIAGLLALLVLLPLYVVAVRLVLSASSNGFAAVALVLGLVWAHLVVARPLTLLLLPPVAYLRVHRPAFRGQGQAVGTQ